MTGNITQKVGHPMPTFRARLLIGMISTALVASLAHRHGDGAE